MYADKYHEYTLEELKIGMKVAVPLFLSYDCKERKYDGHKEIEYRYPIWNTSTIKSISPKKHIITLASGNKFRVWKYRTGKNKTGLYELDNENMSQDNRHVNEFGRVLQMCTRIGNIYAGDIALKTDDELHEIHEAAKKLLELLEGNE